MDAGTSGGVWGLENGYCLMVGASHEVAQTMTPILQALAPAPDRGWAHVGPVGAGHFTKMIHNGIEYGMMQALAEGLDLLRGKEEFDLDLAQITELWRHCVGGAQLAARSHRRGAGRRPETRQGGALCRRFRRGSLDGDRVDRSGRGGAGADAGLADALRQPGRARLRLSACCR